MLLPGASSHPLTGPCRQQKLETTGRSQASDFRLSADSVRLTRSNNHQHHDWASALLAAQGSELQLYCMPSLCPWTHLLLALPTIVSALPVSPSR